MKYVPNSPATRWPRLARLTFLVSVLASAVAMLAPSTAAAAQVYNYKTYPWGYAMSYRVADYAGGVQYVNSFWFACDDQGTADNWFWCEFYATHPWGPTSYGSIVHITTGYTSVQTADFDSNYQCYAGNYAYQFCIGTLYHGANFYHPAGTSYSGWDWATNTYSVATDWGPMGATYQSYWPDQ